MPKRKAAAYPAEWFEKAEQDLQRVTRRLAEEDIEDGAFHLQQAIEKFLKGYLISTGWKLKKIHDLEALLDDAVRMAPELEAYRELCQQVTGYYLVERYPALGTPPSLDEVGSGFLLAQRLSGWIRRKIG